MTTPTSKPTPEEAAAPRDVTESDDDSAPASDGSGMGVSSEIVGESGPGQVGTSGTRYVGHGHHLFEPGTEGAAPGSVHPAAPSPPRAAYPSLDPDSGKRKKRSLIRKYRKS